MAVLSSCPHYSRHYPWFVPERGTLTCCGRCRCLFVSQKKNKAKKRELKASSNQRSKSTKLHFIGNSSCWHLFQRAKFHLKSNGLMWFQIVQSEVLVDVCHELNKCTYYIAAVKCLPHWRSIWNCNDPIIIHHQSVIIIYWKLPAVVYQLSLHWIWGRLHSQKLCILAPFTTYNVFLTLACNKTTVFKNTPTRVGPRQVKAGSQKENFKEDKGGIYTLDCSNVYCPLKYISQSHTYRNV